MTTSQVATVLRQSHKRPDPRGEVAGRGLSPPPTGTGFAALEDTSKVPLVGTLRHVDIATAQSRREQGVAQVFFSLDRQGLRFSRISDLVFGN